MISKTPQWITNEGNPNLRLHIGQL